MAKKTKIDQALVELDKIEAKQLVEISYWTKVQKKIIKDNPFVKITDTATYQQAKKNRTALLKGKTSLLGTNGQENIIRTTFRNLLTGSIQILEDLSGITQPHYQKQQEEVKRYEAIIEEKRQEKFRKAEEKRLEEENRIKNINNEIEKIYNNYKKDIEELDFDGIEIQKSRIGTLKYFKGVEEFEEFEVTFWTMVERLEVELAAKIQTLETAENQRIEAKVLKAERERLKKIKEDQEKEQEKIDAEKKRLAKIEADRKAEQEKAKEIQKAKENKIALEKRLKAMQPDKVKAQGIIDSLNFDAATTIESEPVKHLINLFATDVAALINEYTEQLKNLK